MMRLRYWPPRRIGRMWLIGCLLEGLIILALAVTGDPIPDWARTAAPEPRQDPVFADVPEMSRTEFEAALRQRGYSITRQALPSGDTLVRIGKDASYVVAQRRGDAITLVDASPDVRQAGAAIGFSFGKILEELEKLVLFMLAVLLPIPVLLVSVTFLWGVLRLIHRTRPATG